MKPEKHHAAPHEKDFTGGMSLSPQCSYIGTTGEKEVDEKVRALAEELSSGDRGCMLAEMMVTAVRLSRGIASDGDFKMMNRALKEMRHANEIFEPYRGKRKVAVFGSARTQPDEAEYQTAVRFSKRLTEEGYMTITGAGPGIMAAGNEGAGKENSFGLNINLPFETSANDFINNDEKLIDFNFFFTRKLSFVKEADAAVAFPGGVGTMDELFEALTLIQTGKATVYPIVLIDAKGGKYWKFWMQFMSEHLMRLNLISETDFALFKITDNIEVAIDEIVQFYSNFHSYRYCGDKLVLRIERALTESAVEKLQMDFSDISKDGKIEQTGALEEEFYEEDLKDMTRIVLRHKRRDFGRLRMLIDALNIAETV
ncbi:MAG: LOG family protein [Akkermansiaceae bacterium]